MEINAARIKEHLHSRGIDLVGIADATTLSLGRPARPATFGAVTRSSSPARP